MTQHLPRILKVLGSILVPQSVRGEGEGDGKRKIEEGEEEEKEMTWALNLY